MPQKKKMTRKYSMVWLHRPLLYKIYRTGYKAHNLDDFRAVLKSRQNIWVKL